VTWKQFTNHYPPHIANLDPQSALRDRGLRNVHSLGSKRRRHGGGSLADDEAPDVLLRPSGGTPSELVLSSLFTSLVGHLVVSQHLRLVLFDDTDVDVGTGSEIVEHSRSDRTGDEVDGFLALRDGRMKE
jgi:hypothetical protein